MPRTPLTFVLCSALALLPQSPLAAYWNLMSCDPAGEHRWRQFEQEVRASKPGSTLYAPKPYPTNEAEVIADFLYRFKEMHQDKPGHFGSTTLPNDEKVTPAILGGRASYHVTRVENWTQLRCGWQHKQDFYFLVQVVEIASGKELTRAVIDYSGLFIGMMNLTVVGNVEPSAKRLLPIPAAAMDEVNREFGIQGTDPEYVTTWGTINCDMMFPCLAFHQNGLSYVLYHHGPFEVSPKGPKLRQGVEVGTAEKAHATLATLAADERLISLGGPLWTVARKASTTQIRHGLSNFH
jgi:hypothetical protein